jgi:hypothetical protein
MTIFATLSNICKIGQCYLPYQAALLNSMRIAVILSQPISSEVSLANRKSSSSEMTVLGSLLLRLS